MTTYYRDDDNDGLCDWCGEPDHRPAHCPDIMDKSIGTFRRAVSRRRKKLWMRLPRRK